MFEGECNQEVIERIKDMEDILDRANFLIENEPEEVKSYLSEIDRLKAYYESQAWKDDFALDEAGKLPADLKRGVLSEDGIYDMLENLRDLKIDFYGGMMSDLKLIEKDNSSLEQFKNLFRTVFSAPPWNEDWSDDAQLEEYLRDIMEIRNPIIYGLYEGDEMIGMCIGCIRHWYGGTEYFIQELCLHPDYQGKGYGRKFFELIEGSIKERGINSIYLLTDRNMPAHDFYQHIGYTEMPEITSFIKDL